MAGITPSNPVGITFEYSNLSYMLLGRIIKVASGISFQEFITKEIFTPLEMNDSNWNYEEGKKEDLSIPYFYEKYSGQFVIEPYIKDGIILNFLYQNFCYYLFLFFVIYFNILTSIYISNIIYVIFIIQHSFF
jgi:CubicO group peptidase (beta-lactamase class C family)